jgi:putative DNA primase/helicase
MSITDNERTHTAHDDDDARVLVPHATGFNLTDMGNAERLAAGYGEDLRYVHQWNKWLRWDGRRWVVDNRGEVVKRAKLTVRSIYGEAAQVEDEDERESLVKHAIRSESRNRIGAMIGLAQSEPGMPVDVGELDSDPWLLNVENGTIDLRSGKLRAHDPENLISKLTPVEYALNAEAPTWDAFLKRVLPSEEVRTFVQRAVGYSLTGDVSEQVLFFLHGSGANGKSTFLNAMLDTLGDYSQQAAPELLTVKNNAHPTELARLKGARFVPSVEVEEGKRMAESLVKQMTGGDRIAARFMRQDFFDFEPTHKVPTKEFPHPRHAKRDRRRPWRKVTGPMEDSDKTIQEDDMKQFRSEQELRLTNSGCISTTT